MGQALLSNGGGADGQGHGHGDKMANMWTIKDMQLFKITTRVELLSLILDGSGITR